MIVMQFEVPQFIEIEDKIFGPLTWKQFVYLGGGAGVAVIAFFLLPFLLFILVAIPFVTLTAALAFYPVNNRPFSIFLESMYIYFTSTRLYLWKRRSMFTPKKIDPKIAHLPPRVQHIESNPAGQAKLSSLSRQLELNALAKTE